MSSFWQGKRVVVTGGAGFLGSHLCPLLFQAGAHVLILDDWSRGNNLKEGESSFVQDDAGEIENCLDAFRGAEVVFNLAASVAGVLYNQSHQLEMFERNMRLQTAPVIAAERAGVSHFLQVSSVCVYAPDHQTPAFEGRGQWDEPVDANVGYSWSKRMGERAALWSSLPHGVIVRPSNMYGPRDYFDDRAHVIPALIRKCLFDDIIRVHGTGREVREFLYVEDCARGMLAAVEHGQHGEVYNLGTNGRTKIDMATLVMYIQKETGTLDKPVEYIGGDGGDAARWSNCDKAERDLGWTYETDLTEGLRRTVEWYQAEGMAASAHDMRG
jgi:nucleoside-diphosphate-sugar epimerase